ncbi:low affinity immunoglobulin epsilon Fc receptor isoform X4 [Sciurus carolinensis]|uniref:low affinity immunoglobulin epsilon Fc receptor isoform X4 n=1 Tax=Sciurus carolinensis TaxID=30640 RepID=UPI001FB26F56|nr:low affinity immunoglobulin epsilon Fc receptor isoform X4 [Sciurus carolinensis]
MEGRRYAGFSEPPRKRCCRQRLLLVLLGMLTTALWAGLLTLLLLWHWDTMRTLRQLEDSAARNVSQVSRDLHRYQSDQMAQKSQAAQLSRNMQELRARQKQMESQDSELSWNLDRLLADLSDTKSQSLNQRRAASDSLEKLQEEVEKLRIQILVSKGSACNTCPEQWLHFQQKCYYFGKGAKRWVQARFTCSDLEGRLVSIHSQEEQDFLTKHANKRGSWIGLRDLDLEGEFIWMDGSPVGYSNWNPGEPNNQDQGEDCVMMRGSGKWNDASCRSQLDAWVCERLATCGPPAPSASGDLSEPAPPRGL